MGVCVGRFGPAGGGRGRAAVGVRGATSAFGVELDDLGLVTSEVARAGALLTGEDVAPRLSLLLQSMSVAILWIIRSLRDGFNPLKALRLLPHSSGSLLLYFPNSGSLFFPGLLFRVDLEVFEILKLIGTVIIHLIDFLDIYGIFVY